VWVEQFNQQKAMKKNIGTIDRIIRIILGGGLLAWAATGGPIWAWIGVVPLLTGLIRFCPAYCLFGGTTCGKAGCCKP
jgi:hypothetical protein